MDPRKSRFSPYETRGGPGGPSSTGPTGVGGRQSNFRNNNNNNNQPPSPQRGDVFYGRGEPPRRNLGMSGNNNTGGGGGGGPMMRAKGSRFQRTSEYDNNEYMNSTSVDRTSLGSTSSYHTAATSRRAGGSRWEPRRDNNWDDDRGKIVSIYTSLSERVRCERRERHTHTHIAYLYIYIGKESIPGRERKREGKREECYSLVATIFLFFFLRNFIYINAMYMFFLFSFYK